MSNSIKLAELNEFISCPVCHGYLIDATTVNECLHTFCKSCIVKHIKNDNNKCPKCDTVIHESSPIEYIAHDRNKQDIVYKLVPQLYIAELNRKIAVHEIRGIDAITRLVLKKKFIHVMLVQKNHHKYTNIETVSTSTNDDTDLGSDYISNDNSTIDNNNGSKNPPEDKKVNRGQHTIYLKCPLTIRAHHIKKLLAVKYQLEANDRINLYYKGDVVSDTDQITNLAQSLTFCIHYEISRLLTTANTFQSDQKQHCDDEDDDDTDCNSTKDDQHEDTEPPRSYSSSESELRIEEGSSC